MFAWTLSGAGLRLLCQAGGCRAHWVSRFGVWVSVRLVSPSDHVGRGAAQPCHHTSHLFASHPVRTGPPRWGSDACHSPYPRNCPGTNPFIHPRTACPLHTPKHAASRKRKACNNI